jgi:hypothetical protein
MKKLILVKSLSGLVGIITLGLLLVTNLNPAMVDAKPAKASAGVTGKTTSTSSIADQCTSGFFGLEPWFKFLPDDDFYGSSADSSQGESFCGIKCFNVLDQGSAKNDCGQSKSDIPLVLLAVVDDLLRIAGLVALGFVIYGAFQFVTSQGSPDGTNRARNTVINALIGMAVATIAIAAVSYLGNTFGA